MTLRYGLINNSFKRLYPLSYQKISKSEVTSYSEAPLNKLASEERRSASEEDTKLTQGSRDLMQDKLDRMEIQPEIIDKIPSIMEDKLNIEQVGHVMSENAIEIILNRTDSDYSVFENRAKHITLDIDEEHSAAILGNGTKHMTGKDEVDILPNSRLDPTLNTLRNLTLLYKKWTNPHSISPTQERKLVPHRKIDWQGIYDPYIFAYSAYYDDRKLKRNTEWIVVLGLMSVETKQKNKKFFRCCIYYSNFSSPQVAKPEMHIFAGIDFKTSENVTIRDFIFWCPLSTNGIAPTKVSIMVKKKTLFTLPVTQPPRPDKVGKLLLCLKSIYIPYEENYKPLDIEVFIEWVEMNRILGVEHITVYLHSLAEDMHEVLYYYYNIGYFDFVSLGPIDWDNYIQPRAIGVNDCMYWNMHSYRYIINIDPDEIIVLKHFPTLIEFLDDFSMKYKDRRVSVIMFQPKVFYMENYDNKSLKLRFMKHERYSIIGNYKIIVNVNGCLKVSSHRCKVHANGFEEVKISPDDGASYHFKTCETARINHKPSQCSKALDKSMKDNRMISFKNQLQARVDLVLHALNIIK